MKIIKPSVEFYGAVPTDYEGALRFIEMAGRTCYRSEDKITPDSAEAFVRKLIKAGHLAMVEHSNFVVTRQGPTLSETATAMIQAGKYLNVIGSEDNELYIGGSLTAWYNRFLEISNAPAEKIYLSMFEPFRQTFAELFFPNIPFVVLPEDVWETCPHNEIPKELHRYSAKFICDRGVSHELVRHRPCSFAQESTRYVRYDGNMEFIEPDGFMDWDENAAICMEEEFKRAELAYNYLLSNGGLKPQQARAVLPNALKTEIVVTADAAEWAHIRKLRTAKSSHPDMQRVMNMMPWEEFLC
jgi:thymidylate synthase (FAD)